MASDVVKTYLVTVTLAIEIDEDGLASEEDLKLALAANFVAHPLITGDSDDNLAWLAEHISYEGDEDGDYPDTADLLSEEELLDGLLVAMGFTKGDLKQ